MPAVTAPRYGVLYGWAAGEDFWGGPMNQNMVLMDALMNPYILNMNFGSPPQNVEDGDQYIVATPSSGDWANQDGNMAYRLAGQWVFFTPTRGLRARLVNINAWIWYDGVQWVDETTNQTPGTDPGVLPLYYDIGGTVPYAVEQNEWIMFLPLVQAVSLPKNAVGSSFRLVAGIAGYVELGVYRNATKVGRIMIPAGATTGQFDIPSPVSFGAGDIFAIQAPADIIAGFKNFGWAFRLNIVT